MTRKLIDKWDVVFLLNKGLRFVDLLLMDCQEFAELESKRFDLACADGTIERVESELQECQRERDALKVKVALLNLQDVARTVGYQVHWTREGVGEAFTLIAGADSLPFRQELDDIEHALEVVLHDAAVRAESEAHR
jgi:hypothetical protein